MAISEIAKRLRKLRLEHNFTLQGVASSLGISQATYSRIEYGTRDLTFKEAQLLAKLYHTPIEELFTDDEGELLSEYNEFYCTA
jgi:transcriptional regulator with XRE-family HTH domain